MQYPGIWRVEMAVMNFAALLVAVRSYIWKHVRKKRNVIALLTGYLLFLLLLLLIFYHSGQTLTGYLVGNINFDESVPYSYSSNVKAILQGASLVGPNTALSDNSYVLDFMEGRSNPLLTALVYGGWLPAIAMIVLEFIFIAAAAAVLIQHKRKDGMDVILCMAWMSLAIRVVAGILYSFGVPLPILLPFTGKIGLIADSMALGLLITGCITRKADAWLDRFLDHVLHNWDDEEDDEDDE
jgi:hypothetical protein